MDVNGGTGLKIKKGLAPSICNQWRLVAEWLRYDRIQTGLVFNSEGGALREGVVL